jgi:hypothetical protein
MSNTVELSTPVEPGAAVETLLSAENILITPRLTLRPPIAWDADDLADITGSHARAVAIIATASHVILRERVIGWVLPGGTVLVGQRFRGRSYGREALNAVRNRPGQRDSAILSQSETQLRICG